MKLNDRIYNVLKWLVVIVLPAIGTLYTALGTIWGFPFVEAIPASILAIDTFLGAVLCISTNEYNRTK